MLVQIGEKEQGCSMILGVKDQYPKAKQSVIQKAEYEKKKFNCDKKANKNKLLFKDQKILNFYTKFKSIVFKDIKKKDFAIAVSGGADSLCLAYFSKIYSIQTNSRAHVLIVDHKLRKEQF